MATYPIQPNLQAFEVPVFEQPLEFLFQVARQKQLQFDKGLEQTRAEFNSMEALPVSSQYAIGKRDMYMKDASEKLRKISGADFSMEENRYAAHSIYKPLTSDKDILLDLQKSRQGQKQIAHMDKLENSKDEKQRGQYWATGREYVNRSVRQLQNAKTSEELKSVEMREFVPYVDVISKLNGAAKDLQLKVEIDHVTGGYILTERNGKKANLPFYLFAQSQLGAQERDVFRVMGAVEGDRRIDQEVYAKGIPEDIARQTLATEAVQRRFDDYSDQISDNKHYIDNLTKKKKELETAGVTDQTIADWTDATNKIDLIEKQNELIENKLRDIGFTKISGQYVPNERYQNTVKVFAKDLSLPYAEDAARNVTTNWAAGFASATAGLEIKADPNYAKAIDLQMKELELRGKLAEAAASKGKTSKEDEAKENFINDPLQVGYNPYGKEQMSSYDFFKAQKKAFGDGLMSKGVDYIQDALPGIGLDPDFLNAITENMKNGKGDTRITEMFGHDAQTLKNVQVAIEAGKIPGVTAKDPTYSELFKGLISSANVSAEEKLKSAKNEQEISHIIRSKREVEHNLEAYQVFKDDEKQIQAKILSKPEYKNLTDGQGEFISKEQYVKSITGFNSAKEATELLGRDKFPTLMQDTDNPAATEEAKAVRSIGNVEKDYDKIRKKFDADFANFVNTENPKFLSKTPGTSDQYAYVYPVLEFQSRKNPTSNERETSEIAISRAFSQETLRDQTKVTNLADLGSADAVMPILKMFQNELTDFEPGMGKLYYVQVSRDGKNPGVMFKPSVEFLKKFSGKDNPLSDATLSKISKYGVEIATDVPEIEKQRPSVVSRLLDINKSYNILPELRGEGFTGHIEKKTNGRGYEIYLTYKKYDDMGNEVVVNNESQNPGAYVPESRLDSLADGLINDILRAYYNYKSKREVHNQSVAPRKIYTPEELETLRKSQQ